MKQPIPKSLILSFFLIGIILGLLFIDTPLIQPAPPPVAEQGTPAPKPAKAAPKPLKRPVQERLSRGIAKVLPEKTAAPVVEPLICDREWAQQVRLRAREIAEIIEQGNELSVRLGREWAFYASGHRIGFVQAFSDSDSCLAGRPRLIRFYFEGQEVAVADPVTGIQMH